MPTIRSHLTATPEPPAPAGQPVAERPNAPLWQQIDPFPLAALVVEADRAARDLLTNGLANSGVKPICAHDLVEVLRVVSRSKVDGAFLHTREKSRGDMVSLVRSSRSNSNVPIVVLHSPAHPRGRSQAISSGCIIANQTCDPLTLDRALRAAFAPMLRARLRYFRASVDSPVICMWGRRSAHGEAVNLSVSGMLARLTPTPHVGSTVSLFLAPTADHRPLTLEGAVVRSDGLDLIGIRFATMPLTHRRRLLESIHHSWVKQLERFGCTGAR